MMILMMHKFIDIFFHPQEERISGHRKGRHHFGYSATFPYLWNWNGSCCYLSWSNLDHSIQVFTTNFPECTAKVQGLYNVIMSTNNSSSTIAAFYFVGTFH